MIDYTIPVQLGSQSYPIYVGQHIFANAALLAKHIAGRQVVIITQDNIASFYLQPLQLALQDYQCEVFLLPDGEQFKTLAEWQKIVDQLVKYQTERSATLIALGGGVVGDMTGFVAACYQRGISYIQIPTTLIAQVDAAIGGKTAVNHAQGKNMVGAFYQPQCVISDIAVLKTLPQREYIAGLAEVIKYGLLGDAAFFAWIEQNVPALLAQDSAALLYVVQMSARMKADIVSKDEKEQGIRSLLNLGHTFGHALETANAYQSLLHGEAVAIGIMMAAKLSANLGWLSPMDVPRILKLLRAFGLMHPDHLPASSDFVRLMRHDKKVRDGKLNLILLKAIGEAVMVTDVTEKQITDAVNHFVANNIII